MFLSLRFSESTTLISSSPTDRFTISFKFVFVGVLQFGTGSPYALLYLLARVATYCTEIRCLAQFYICPCHLALLCPSLHTYCIGFLPLFIHFDTGSRSWRLFPGPDCPLLIFIFCIYAQPNVPSTRFLGSDRFTTSFSPLFLHASWDP